MYNVIFSEKPTCLLEAMIWYYRKWCQKINRVDEMCNIPEGIFILNMYTLLRVIWNDFIGRT